MNEHLRGSVLNVGLREIGIESVRSAHEVLGVNLTQEQAAALSERAIAAVVENFSGCKIRFPKMSDLQRDDRDEEIYRAYKGTEASRSDIAIRYGLTEKQVKNIVASKVRRYQRQQEV